MFMMGLLTTQQTKALDSLELSINELLYQWHDKNKSDDKTLSFLKLEDISVQFNINNQPPTLQITVPQLVLPEPFGKLELFNIQCISFDMAASKFQCSSGKMSIKGLFTPDDLQVDTNFIFQYKPQESFFQISFSSLKIDNALLDITFTIKQDQWFIDSDVKRLDYKNLSYLFDYYFKEQLKEFEDISVIASFTGKLSGHIKQENKEVSLESIDLDGSLQSISYTYVDNLSDNLACDFNFSLSKLSVNQTSYSLGLHNIAGEILQNDLYVNFQGIETIDFNFTTDRNSDQLDIDKLVVNIPGIMQLKTEGVIRQNKEVEIVSGNASLNLMDLKKFNALYLANILEGTDYEGLELEGKLISRLQKNRSELSTYLHMEKLSTHYDQQFTLIELDGDIYWDNKTNKFTSVQNSSLSWQELVLNDLPFGKSQLDFKWYKNNIHLIDQVEIPLFDGALHINTLEVTNIFQSENEQQPLNIAIDGMIKPVSLKLISNHFDWPELDGKLSAVIPYTTYNEQYLKVGGAMLMQVFDGNIIIKDLIIEQPLLPSARLFANIDLNNLNLKSLTRTYNFGEIEGRLEGKFHGLILDSWIPVEFDAYVRTPDKDSSRHRISQKAIDNLSSLGGASGILSRSFLSVFETFGYDKLGLSCKLKNNVCIMDGIETKSGTNSAYYIVKGGGIPRIDVMGFQRVVNWQVLTSRLQAIQSANEAVIQ